LLAQPGLASFLKACALRAALPDLGQKPPRKRLQIGRLAAKNSRPAAKEKPAGWPHGLVMNL